MPALQIEVEMQERKRKQAASGSVPTQSSKTQLNSRAKWLVSIAVMLHLTAVFVEPFQFFTRSQRGESEAGALVRRLVSPYTELAYLNHGYFFFAPEPGPSHLIGAKLTYDDGDQAELRFPDKQAQWPRLLYHRHFMLAEFLNQMHAPPVDLQLAEVDPVMFKGWQSNRNQYEMIRSSMEQHLTSRYEAESAKIVRLEHVLPSSDDVLVKGRPLNDPALYIELPDEPLEPAPGEPQVGPYTTPLLPPVVPPVTPQLSPQGAGEEIQP
ncbi:MAG: hypothetical protein Aurels2KO_16480 [Aureliella sp.]